MPTKELARDRVLVAGELDFIRAEAPADLIAAFSEPS